MGNKKSVVTTRFSEVGRRILYGRLSLYQDRIALAITSLTGFKRESISLVDVADVEWVAGAPGGSSIILKMNDGSERQLFVKEGGLLRFEIMRLAELTTGRSELPGPKRKMSSAA